MRRLLPGATVICNCGRPDCGLLVDPPMPDKTDAAAMWLPNLYGNAVKDSEFQVSAKGSEIAMPVRYATRLEAARDYAARAMQGKDEVLEYLRDTALPKKEKRK